MNVTWRRTPPMWAITDAAAHYAAMAAKGWMLESRGTHWDRFRRAEPQRLRFWLELTRNRGLGDIEELPEEQIALYEDCGWTLVDQNQTVYVFSAPESAEIPLPYDIGDPQQEAMVQCIRKSYRSSVITMAITLALAGLWIAIWGSVPLHELLRAWWLMCFWLLWLAKSSWDDLYGFGALTRLQKHLRRGEWPTAKRRLGYHIPRRVLAGLATICLLIAGGVEIWNLTETSKPLPVQTDGQYLTASFMGMERLNEDSNWAKRIGYNELDVERALPFFTQYHGCEAIQKERGEITYFQDVYVLFDSALAMPMARSLIEESTFADPEVYRPIEIDGLDAAWYVPGGFEYVAVLGSCVTYGTVIGGASDGDELLVFVLEQTARLWNA